MYRYLCKQFLVDRMLLKLLSSVNKLFRAKELRCWIYSSGRKLDLTRSGCRLGTHGCHPLPVEAKSPDPPPESQFRMHEFL